MSSPFSVPFKFCVSEIVLIGGQRCTILEVEMFEGAPDYLCATLDASTLIPGQSEFGAGWVRESEIEKLKNEGGTK